MKNKNLGHDYITRSGKRLKALDALYKEDAWPDVVREAQEIVELALKGLLRGLNIEAPRVHDVSEVLQQNQAQLSKVIVAELDRICEISRTLRRDRELAFYGSEDLTPLEFYKKKDATAARDSARWIVEIVSKAVK